MRRRPACPAGWETWLNKVRPLHLLPTPSAARRPVMFQDRRRRKLIVAVDESPSLRILKAKSAQSGFVMDSEQKVPFRE
jgi:hypothetical protein